MKRKFIHRYLVLPAVLLLAGGCHRTDLEEGTAEEIRFQVSEEWQSGNDTRAFVVSSAGDLIPKGILINAYVSGTTTPYISDAQVAYDGGSDEWRFYQLGVGYVRYYWPNEGSLDFAAYTPYNLTSTYVSIDTYTAAGGPAFTCSALPVTSAGQSSVREFLYAYETGKNKAADASTGVTLEFHHPFAKLTLQLNASHWAVHSLNTITFKNIKNNGSFTHGSSPQWSTSGVNQDLVITLNQAVAKNTVLSADQLSIMGIPFVVIPQSYTAANQIEVTITWADGWAPKTYTFANPISEWIAGKHYTYTLTLNDNIGFVVTVEDWDSDHENSRTFTFGETINTGVTVSDWDDDDPYVNLEIE